MRVRPWQVSRVEPRGDFRVFDVQALHSRREPGEADHVFFRIGSPAWVNVIALTPDDQCIMVHQYRHGAAKITLEIPGGLVDAGEDPAVAAARELLEETGYRPASVRKIGEVSPNPALFANRLHTFVAEGCEKVAEISNDTAEETVVELVPVATLPARVRAGDIDHALVLAAFQWWQVEERG